MRNYSVYLFGLLVIGCSSEPRTSELTNEYFKNEISMFGVSAELRLSSDQSFTITHVDLHSGTGGVYSGTYTWNNKLLTLNYQDSRQKQFFLDSAKLYQIEELDSLVIENQRFNQGYQILTLSINPGLTPFSQPARTNWQQWNSGRIENLKQLVQDFKNDPDNYFEEK